MPLAWSKWANWGYWCRLIDRFSCGIQTSTSRSSSAIHEFADMPIEYEFAGHTSLVPWQLFHAPDDARFMTLTREKHAVSWPRQIERQSDGVPSVGAAKECLPHLCACRLGPSRGLRDDRVRIFEP